MKRARDNAALWSSGKWDSTVACKPKRQGQEVVTRPQRGQLMEKLPDSSWGIEKNSDSGSQAEGDSGG